MKYLLLIVLMLTANTALAKKVTIEWKPIKSASMYEIMIEKDGKKIAQKTLADSSWTGELQFGLYSFQIRAIDIIKRAGKWSDPRALVIMPKAPEILSPKGGKTMGLYEQNASIPLKWEEVPGITKYKVEVSKGRQTIYSTIIQGTAFDIKSQGAGDYSWKVAAIIDAPGGKSWESKPSDIEDFEIKAKQLANVTPIEPLGQILPNSNGKVKFKWRSVDGAQGYELTLVPIKLRSPATSTEKTFTVSEEETTIDLKDEGKYRWVIRAIANVDSKGAAGAAGPKTTAAFELTRNAKFFEGLGYVALSTLISSYTYQSVSKVNNKTGSLDSIALSFRLSGEYFPHPQWGIGAAIENTSLEISNNVYQRKTYELTGRYRMQIGNQKYGWFFYPKLGIEARDYFLVVAPKGITSATTSFEVFNMMATGPSAGFDLRKQLTDRWSLGLKTGYWLPTAVSGDATALIGTKNNRNYNVGLQGIYWANKSILIGIGAYHDNRSLSFSRAASTAGQAEEVSMDADYFFGSIIYTFGN